MNKRTQLITFVLLSTLLSMGDVRAIGLGKLKIYSHLNQPLRAEIEVIGQSENELNVQLGQVEDYEKDGLEYNPSSASMQAKIVRKQGKVFIQLNSRETVDEVIFNLVVKLKDGDQEIKKNYRRFIEFAPHESIILSNTQTTFSSDEFKNSKINTDTNNSTNLNNEKNSIGNSTQNSNNSVKRNALDEFITQNTDNQTGSLNISNNQAIESNNIEEDTQNLEDNASKNKANKNQKPKNKAKTEQTQEEVNNESTPQKISRKDMNTNIYQTKNKTAKNNNTVNQTKKTIQVEDNIEKLTAQQTKVAQSSNTLDANNKVLTNDLKVEEVIKNRLSLDPLSANELAQTTIPSEKASSTNVDANNPIFTTSNTNLLAPTSANIASTNSVLLNQASNNIPTLQTSGNGNNAVAPIKTETGILAFTKNSWHNLADQVKKNGFILAIMALFCGIAAYTAYWFGKRSQEKYIQMRIEAATFASHIDDNHFDEDEFDNGFKSKTSHENNLLNRLSSSNSQNTELLNSNTSIEKNTLDGYENYAKEMPNLNQANKTSEANLQDTLLFSDLYVGRSKNKKTVKKPQTYTFEQLEMLDKLYNEERKKK